MTWASARDAEASTWTDKWHPYKGNLCDSAYRGGGFNGFKAGADFGRSWAESCHKKTPEIMTERDAASLMSELQAAEERERILIDALRVIASRPLTDDANWCLERGLFINDEPAEIARAALALRDKGGGKE